MLYVLLLSSTLGDPSLTRTEYYLSARFIFDSSRSVFNIIYTIVALPYIKHYSDYIECAPTYCDEPQMTPVVDTQINDAIDKKKMATQ